MKEKNNLLIFILTIGVFGIINTEMGVLGILPLLAEKFSISIAQAGLLVSLFALAVAAAGPVMPLLFAGIDRKRVMLLVLSVFVMVILFLSLLIISQLCCWQELCRRFSIRFIVRLLFLLRLLQSARKQLPGLLLRSLWGYRPGWYWEYRSAALLPAVFR